MTSPYLPLVGVAVVAAVLSGGAVHGWHLFQRRRRPPVSAPLRTQAQPQRYGADPSIYVADDLRRLCQEDPLLSLRDAAHQHIRSRLSDAVDAIEAYLGRRVVLQDVDLGRILAEVAKGREVTIAAESPIPHVWADHVRLARSITWMIEECLRSGHGATVEVEVISQAVALRVWPRINMEQALRDGRPSMLPHLSGANRFQTERSWAEAQGGRLMVRALSGGDPAFSMDLPTAVSMSAADLK